MGLCRDYYTDPFLHVSLWEPGLVNIGVDQVDSPPRNTGN